MKHPRFSSQKWMVLCAALALGVLPGCFNNGSKAKKVTSSSSTLVSSTPTGGSVTISNLQETTVSGAAALVITIPSTSTSFQSLCGASLSAASCVCSLQWVEDVTDPTDSTKPPTQITRKPVSALIGITANTVTCKQPTDYQSLTSGTSVQVAVVRLADNNSYVTSTATMLKNQGMLSATLQPIWDIARYTCSDTFSRNVAIHKGVLSFLNSDNKTVKVALSTRFCVPGKTSGTTSTGNAASSTTNVCAENPSAQVVDSNQRNAYNFYIRASQPSITSVGGQFTCPVVTEGIPRSSGGNGVNRPYPMDQSFALSSLKSAQFSVPVEANLKINGGPGDPSSTGSTCGTSQSADSSSNEGSSPTVVGCLGFATKPLSNGVCPNIQVGSDIKPTFRLRKYFAVFPPTFAEDGSVRKSGNDQVGQSVDTVFVLDRPIVQSSKVVASVLGPKPCPFAYQDVNNVLGGGGTQYVATNDAAWNGKNIDGIKLPTPVAGESLACTATFPEYNHIFETGATPTLTFKTINSDPYYIRPIRPWALHYEEDTSFQACAPLPAVMIDPPLQLYTDAATGQNNYCAAIHPNAMPTDAQGQTYIGSARTKRSISASVFQGGQTKPLPLLAPVSNVRDALKADNSFGCQITQVMDSTTGLVVGKTYGGATGNCCGSRAPNWAIAGGLESWFEPSTATKSCQDTNFNAPTSLY